MLRGWRRVDEQVYDVWAPSTNVDVGGCRCMAQTCAPQPPHPTPVDTRVAPPFLDEFVTRLIPTLGGSACAGGGKAPAPQLVVELVRPCGDGTWPASRSAPPSPHSRCSGYCIYLPCCKASHSHIRGCCSMTVMTRVLDVLEAFLSMHGHTYLRLDGATRVDRRQPLVDRFNSDPRLFAFILSTRSGGVGLNLAGADCVIFYDSDWNPTMDAQAQDRCHRIGQTRDVHVYRLVTAATVEENILRKAEQKRALGHLAIEDGHFTTSYLRAANIHELFGGPRPLLIQQRAADLECARCCRKTRRTRPPQTQHAQSAA
ncbi:Helicase SRCAP [Eumeta japonica]|uniref:Helicase SRCAP n=1 Tax=Eumeta variegata TaxID=151549 RepID=A0A4C2AGD3_EUMVA|nr:Helicase SRCAP [Eumeta japonica]